MHNLHFVVIMADDAQSACSMVEREIADWGRENNWRTICGCVSQDNEIYVYDEAGGYRVEDYPTIEKINECINKWANIADEDKLKIKNLMLRVIENQPLTGDDLYALKEFAKEMYEKNNRRQLNVLEDFYYCFQYDECGVTHYEWFDEENKKKYVVFIDMHS